MHKFDVYKTDYFAKLVKKLSKKYPSIENDIDDFLDKIDDIKDLGVVLGQNLYKVRLKNTDNNKGKSGGYRLISYLLLKEKELTLLYIYSKSDIANIKETDLDKIILKTLRST